MLTRCDKLIIISVVLLAVSVYCVFTFFLFEGQPESVLVLVDGKEYATYKLSAISDTKTVEINTEFGYNVLEITSKSTKMVDASCKDKIDIQSGEISKPGQMLVCVPNRVSVKIVGKEKYTVDKVTY